MKIPFDIKHKSKIEEGVYKVVTDDGRPVKVLCWDANDSVPIVALIDGYAWQLNKEGKTLYYGAMFPYLFIETPEPDLSELLHQAVCRAINEPNIPYEERKLYSEKLIDYIEELEGYKKFVENFNPADISDNEKNNEPF